VAITKANPELTSIMGKVLDSISAADQEHIKNKWMSIAVAENIKPATLIKYGLGILLVFTGISGWNFRPA